MKIIHALKWTLYSVVLTWTIICSSALAQDATSANTWENFEMTMHYSGNGYTKKRRTTIDYGEVLHTTSSTTSGLMFSCLEGNFRVAISWKPQDLRAAFQETSRRRKAKQIDMKLNDGEKKGLGAWIYKPSLGTLSSSKRSQAAKLYNAVVRGQSFTLFMEGKEPVSLNLPKPNRAFAEFGAKCGIGKLAKKKP
jgi:hypothetical protein